MTNGFFSSYTPLPRHQNARAEAVNAIFDAVIVGFDGVPAAASIQQDRVTHCTDTGSANAYAIAPTYAIVSYVAGQHYSFVATNANTMASTVNVSALGVKTIKRQDGTDLSAGDIASGQMVDIRYDGTNFQLLSMPSGSVAASAASATAAASSATAAATSATTSAASATQAAASATTAGATVSQWTVAGGTADAITATFPTTVTSLTDGLVLGFRASAANATTTPTFKADGTTAHTITKRGGSALVAGDIPAALAECVVRYNLANTRWELQNPAQAPVPTRQVLTSGSAATYTTPAGCRQIRVRMVGGGGGGGSNSAGAANGSAGGATSFNSIVANGGGAGLSNNSAGSGGTGGTGGSSPTTFRSSGQAGSCGIAGANSGGSGGSSVLGGGASGDNSAVANSGGGGGGDASASGNSGGGGGGGEYVEYVVSTPAGTYTYTVGALGAKGGSGGNGGTGVIIVDEFY